MPPSHQPEQVICILGMHRSGTSCLTGSLQQYGVDLGKHHTWNKHNLKGNRENQDIVNLNDEVLLANGGSWDHPPRKIRWESSHLQQAQEILAENVASRHWSFKDPRTLLTLKMWQHLLPDMRYIGIFRHPLAVANSLKSRGKMPLDQGMSLWYQYNKILLTEQKRRQFPLLCFDWSEQQFQRKLETVLEGMGLDSNSSNDSFYSNELQHHKHSGFEQLPWRVKRLYKQLNKRTV